MAVRKTRTLSYKQLIVHTWVNCSAFSTFRINQNATFVTPIAPPPHETRCPVLHLVHNCANVHSLLLIMTQNCQFHFRIDDLRRSLDNHVTQTADILSYVSYLRLAQQSIILTCRFVWRRRAICYVAVCNVCLIQVTHRPQVLKQSAELTI